MKIKATKQTKEGIPYLAFGKEKYLEFLSTMSDGTEVIIDILAKRSLSQNKLLHLWIGILASEWGEPSAHVKAKLVCDFFGCEEIEYNGKSYIVPVSTSTLDKKTFAEGLTNMYIWALENGYNLPSPDEYLAYGKVD